MKSLLILFSISFLFISNVFGEDLKSRKVDTYIIISDEFSEEVPDGFCRIKGVVTEYKTENPIIGGTVSTIDKEHGAASDIEGKFDFLMPEQDSAIFFYHREYGEIVCWNYDFKNQHVVEINFVSSVKDEMPVMVEKPVIYLYSEEPMHATVELSGVNEFVFSYPSYDNGWNIALNENELMIDGKVYPYLFWEGQEPVMDFVENEEVLEGYFIKTDTAITFLENTLKDLGLNAKESTDFITYWAPRLMRHQYATIQLFIDEMYTEQIAGIHVEPGPDVMRRVFMVFEGTDVPISTKELITPQLLGIEREGFVLIEWGGAELNYASIKGL